MPIDDAEAVAQMTVLHLRDEKSDMRLLLLHINRRIDNGLAYCPMCNAKCATFAVDPPQHNVACPFATFIARINEE